MNLPDIFISAISDAEKSLSLNLVVAGDILNEPIFIQLGLLSIGVIDVENTSGFTILPDFEKDDVQNSDLSFEIVKKMTLPELPVQTSPPIEVETQVIDIAEVQERNFLIDIFLSNDGKRFRTSFVADEDLTARVAKVL